MFTLNLNQDFGRTVNDKYFVLQHGLSNPTSHKVLFLCLKLLTSCWYRVYECKACAHINLDLTLDKFSSFSSNSKYGVFFYFL